MTIEAAVVCAQGGRGERKRPLSGWGSLTPAELDVARLVGEGLGSKASAEKRFISLRMEQAHLTHIYAKPDLTSRVHLATEAVAHP